jgi:hypothetical protein
MRSGLAGSNCAHRIACDHVGLNSYSQLLRKRLRAGS